MSWIEIAKNLPYGQTTRCECPSCGLGTGTSAAIVNHNAKAYTIHCFACDYHDFDSKGVLSLEERKRINELNEEALRVVQKIELPKDITYVPEEFSKEARMWLYKSGLTPTVWRRHSIGYSKRLERVILPVYDTSKNLIWFQCRAILKGQSPKYIQPRGDRSGILYHTGDTGTTRRVIIVEDIMSAIRVGEAVKEHNTGVASTLGTKITALQATHLSTYELCTTWYDGDKAGKRGAYAVRKSIGLLTECSNITTERDPKLYSNKQIRETLGVGEESDY